MPASTLEAEKTESVNGNGSLKKPEVKNTKMRTLILYVFNEDCKNEQEKKGDFFELTKNFLFCFNIMPVFYETGDCMQAILKFLYPRVFKFFSYSVHTFDRIQNSDEF